MQLLLEIPILIPGPLLFSILFFLITTYPFLKLYKNKYLNQKKKNTSPTQFIPLMLFLLILH